MKNTTKFTPVLIGVVLLGCAACRGGVASDEKTPPKTLTTRQLDQVVVSGTVKGYRAEEVPAKDVPAPDPLTADRHECDPIAALTGGVLRVKPKAVVYRSLKPVDDENATVGNVWLSSYADRDAERVMADLDTAVDKCAEPFTTAGLTYRSVQRVGSRDADLVVFRLTGEIARRKITMNYSVVRTKGVVTTFYGVNTLKPENGMIPAAVIEAQLERLAD